MAYKPKFRVGEVVSPKVKFPEWVKDRGPIKILSVGRKDYLVSGLWDTPGPYKCYYFDRRYVNPVDAVLTKYADDLA